MDYVNLFRPLFRKHPDFADYLPWQDLLDGGQGVMTTKDDGVMSVLRLVPQDQTSLSEPERWVLAKRINDAFKLMDDSWAFWLHGKRREVRDYPEASWPDPVSALLDDAYRAQLTATGARWGMTVYLTAWHRQIPAHTNLMDRLFFPTDNRPTDETARLLETFSSGLEQLMSHLGAACHEVSRLNDEQLLTYLHGFISIYDQPVKLTAHTDISYRIKDCKLWPGTRLTLGPHPDERQYIRALTLTEDLPEETSALMWKRIYEVPFGYDWVTRTVPINLRAAESQTTTEQIDRHATKKGGKVMVYEHLIGKDTGKDLEDEYSVDQMKDAGSVRKALLTQDTGMVYQTTTFLIRGFDLDVVDEQTRILQTILQSSGCIVIDEGLNATEAYFGANPGQMHTGWRPMPNVRQLRLTTMNFAFLGCWHAPYTGEQWIERLKGPALTQAVTDGYTAFGVSPYVGDVGHCKKIGPNGSGKSTQMNFENAQWLRYEGSNLFPWDMGGSCRAMVQCLGGAYHDIYQDGLGIQILAHLDQPSERAWIYQWLMNRIYESGVTKDPDVATFVWGCLKDLWEHPEWPRSLQQLLYVMSSHGTHVSALAKAQGNKRSEVLALQYPRIKGAIAPFAHGGPFGHMVDATVDTFALTRVEAFDVMKLADVEECVNGVLEAVFHRILNVCKGQPVRLPFDEAHRYFSNPTFVGILKRVFPWMRRNNVSAAFALQTISQYTESPLAPLLVQNCLTDHYFPDAMAIAPMIAPLYEGMGLTKTDREIITHLTPKQDMYVVKQPEGRRKRGGRRPVSFYLPPVVIAVCGANSQEDHQLMDRLLDTYHAEEFPFRFLEAKGFPDEAKKVRSALARRSLDAPLRPVLDLVANANGRGAARDR